MTTTQYLHKTGEFSTHLALTSFGIGTLLLVLLLNFPSVYLLLTTLGFVVVATMCNLIVLVHLAILFIKHTLRREYFAIKILILLANIPVTYVYFQLLFNKH